MAGTKSPDFLLYHGTMARVFGSVLSLLSAAFILLLLQQEATGIEARSEVDEVVDACLAHAASLTLGASLRFTRTKLRTGQPLTIVALGSSSTTGFGAFGEGTAFPDVMEQELVRLEPGAQIKVINRGRAMEDLTDNIARLDKDVLPDMPDLVIWQIGTNEVVWRGIASHSKEMLADSIRRIKAAGADVILLDLQYAPLVLLSPRHTEMETIIADAARQQNVGLFPRFFLMKKAIDAGVTGLVSWDGLHNSARGYACVGIALARMIDGAVRRPTE
jgi:acyl-CoA thioesterase I